MAMIKCFSTFFLLVAVCMAFSTQIRTLTSLTEEAENGVIPFNYQLFTDLVASPRPEKYTVVILFTLENECPACESAEEIISGISYSYWSENIHKAPENPVFFTTVAYNPDTQDIFHQFSIYTVPVVYVSPTPLSEFESLNVRKYQPSSKIDGDFLLKFINSRTGRKVLYKGIPGETVGKIVLPLLVVICALLLGIKYRRALQKPTGWFIVSCIATLICCGGMVYNVIHGTPLWGTGKGERGETVYHIIASSGRYQYIVEGLLASLLMLLSGGALIALVALHKGKVLNRILGYLLVASFIGTSYLLQWIYKYKSPWYNPGFEPPAGYIKGPLNNDQGNTV